MVDDGWCEICGHSLKVHNELGYCWVHSRRWGDCGCDGTWAQAHLVSSPRALELAAVHRATLGS